MLKHSIKHMPAPSMMKSRPSDARTYHETETVRRQNRLPIPPLSSTVKKYVETLEPFILENTGGDMKEFDHELKQHKLLGLEFHHGIGSTLQARLHELDEASPHNWLEDNFWLNKAYHENRAPLVINSNWWLCLQHDANIPKWVIKGQEDLKRSFGFSPWQVVRAAWLMRSLLEMKERLDSQEIFPDKDRTGRWFRHCFSRMWNFARVPQKDCDTFSVPSPSSPFLDKVVVMAGGWMYAMPLYDSKGKSISFLELHNLLRDIVRDVINRKSQRIKSNPIPMLTADERDSWARYRDILIAFDPELNQKYFQCIEDSMFILCLDNYVYGKGKVSPDPTRSELDSHLHNVRSGHNAQNRWFDKPFTLIVESNTRAGVMGEHSPVDALVPSMVAEYMLMESFPIELYGTPPAFPYQAYRPNVRRPVTRLDFSFNRYHRRKANYVQKACAKIIVQSDNSILWFDDYGTRWIKQFAKASPDAYIQMALQLAWYRTSHFFTATYETALTRLFDHGRTETIRTLSTQSRAFVLGMLDPNNTPSERYRLLIDATRVHTQRTMDAIKGRGIDRHLLGLRLLLKPQEGSDLFSDPLFQRSQTWKLSTSGLSEGELFRGTGFGSSYDDGYGVNYTAGPTVLKFGIESKSYCDTTSTSKFKEAIKMSLEEMKNICIKNQRELEAARPIKALL